MNGVGLDTLHVVCRKRELRLCLTGHGGINDKLSLATLEVQTRGKELVARVPVADADRLDAAADTLLVALKRARPFAGGPS